MSYSTRYRPCAGRRCPTATYGHTGVGYCPQQGPCYTHSGPYGFQPHQSYEVPRYVPHPPPPPTSHQAAQAQPPPLQATRLFSNSSQKMDLRWADTDLALGVVGSLD